LVCQAGLEGHHALSLSVELDNPAMALYRAAGFEAVGRADHSMTMRLALAA
jgi:ribosomal protein S18 acetylase RimI-like enzyme